MPRFRTPGYIFGEAINEAASCYPVSRTDEGWD